MARSSARRSIVRKDVSAHFPDGDIDDAKRSRIIALLKSKAYFFFSAAFCFFPFIQATVVNELLQAMVVITNYFLSGNQTCRGCSRTVPWL